MADEQFTVTFDGPALETGSMDIRQLAPALLAVADAVQEANRLNDPVGSPPGLQIKATRPGSFIVDLLLTDPASVVDRALDLFNARPVTAALNLSGLVGIVFGALELIKRLRGRRIRSQQTVRPGWVRITFDDSTTLEVPSASVTLASDLGFRQAARGVVQPLASDGIDSIELSRPDGSAVTVSREDRDAFAIPEGGDELLSDQSREVVVRLLNVAFVHGNKWRVSDGDNPIYASVQDLDFLSRVDTNQERFAAGDLLKVRLRTQQWRSDDQVRNDHVIEAVLDHISGPRAVPLPFVEGDADEDGMRG